MDQHSYIGSMSPAAMEGLYRQFLDNPSSVDSSWQQFFSGFEFARLQYGETGGVNGAVPEQVDKEFKVINLINNGYRAQGHLFTKTNPVRERRKYTPDLSIENFGLESSDLDTVFQAGQLIGIGPAKLKAIIHHLDETYCQSVGAEFKYIRNEDVKKWLEQKMESSKNRFPFSIREKKRMLEKLNEAVAFENFIHTKFTGQKRFSLEGAETLIPALDAVIDSGAELGIKEFVIGMAHRGRLNVLANILGKSYEDIFSEFEGKEFDENAFDGDVKYHLGFSSDVITQNNKKVHLGLTPNPSHLEAVDPIVQGIVRAKIENTPGGNFDQIAPILIHGDAAIAAQGIVYEVIQMSLLKGYATGGTIHLVINNQVGFTTNYIDARSSTYCTDVGKVTLSPVFHVNGDDVEALVYTIRLAMEYRQRFHRDVFIDMLCYRKYGHNEGDEPRFTQPLLYKAIANHPNPREVYNQKLLSQGIVEANLAKSMEKQFKELLQRSLDLSKLQKKTKLDDFKEGNWKGLRFSTPADFDVSPDTSINKKDFVSLAQKISTLPTDVVFFNKLVRLFDDRKKMLEDEGRLDWAMGELMAYATLLEEGHPVRISGQDVERGTFSHRHAVIRLEDREEVYVPLSNLSDQQAKFTIYNSLLSEYGVLGFDYGYSFTAPNSLVVWEAQFGDFGNGAQIIIDQYLSSSEDKWKRMNGIVMLLPHGYEGQGAEHSSARIERFLSLCAEYNMQVANCTTPANFFHALRRQLKREFRKPLIVFTPKSLLRHPRCVSAIQDFTKNGFAEVIDDASAHPEKVSRVAFCSGKVYYDLIDRKEKENNTDLAIVRLEQLYPFPKKQVEAILKKYANATSYLWVQEEPENSGAWSYILRVMRQHNLRYIGREESASPATGSHKQHDKEQKAILDEVFSSQLVPSN
ncbi:MAG: 2-oxoglutarate dehydrogenase E1 component [Bacteroidia bacterium]|jgi:2-oxoglutarate dehydrogenase E1 component|nr:2-oxoglutarate dehydrogenase E1 component [Bacteroidia bacterium]